MKKGFTLLELIVVIIIIGILATLGFTQYAKMVEKGRTAEAKMILGQLRTAEESYRLENGVYVTFSATSASLPIEAPTACATTHYFSYGVVAAGTAAAPTFTATATRCTTGGKTPNFTGTAYTVTLIQTGVWGGTAGYY